MAVDSVRKARRIKPVSEEALSALRWEVYASLQNLLDGLAMLVSVLRLRKPSTYAELGAVLREHGVIDSADEELVKRVARTRNIVAHAYRRLEVDELTDIVHRLLPSLEEFVEKLVLFVKEHGLDPSKKNVLEKLSDVFERNGILLVYLFGSRARGEVHEESDYDFAVLFGRAVDVLEEVELAVELADALGVPADRVDIVSLDKAGLDLAFKIIREGELVYARDEDTRRRFETRVLVNALDFHDLMDVYVAKLSARKPTKQAPSSPDVCKRAQTFSTHQDKR